MKLSFVLAVALVSGCDKKEGGSAPTPVTTGSGSAAVKADKPAETPTDKPADKAASTVTKEQADAFGKKIAEAMAKCDGAAIDAMLDINKFSARAIEAAGPAAASALKNTTLGPSICAGLGSDFSVRYVGVHERDGVQRPRVRTIVRGGVNFLEPVLEARPDGTVIAVDMFSLRNGENMSDLLALVGKFLKHPTGETAARAYVEATQKHGSGDYAGAREAFQRIPPELRQKIKAVALQGLTIDVQASPEVYLASIDEFKKNFPGDASVDMVEIDAHSLRKEHAKLVESLSRLMSKTADDPYVQVMRALAHKDAGDLAAAKADADAALAKEPTLVEAADMVVDVAIAQKQYGDAIKALDAMVATGINKADLVKSAGSDARYAPLTKSPEWKAWVKKS